MSNVEYKRLGDIGKFYGGLSGKSKNDFVSGNAKFITYRNVYTNIALKTDVIETVKIGEKEKQNSLEYGDIIFTGSSETPNECGFSSVVTTQLTGRLYLNSFCFIFRLDDKALLLPEFSKYLFRTEKIRKQIIGTASGVTRFNVSKDKMKTVKIPVPSIEVQYEIVSILDQFYSLCNDITKGLPAEIEARQKQYEYYRDKLLSFQEK